MRPPATPVFDVSLLLAEVRETRATFRKEQQGSRYIAAQTGIPVSTVQFHLSPTRAPATMSVDHATRWMIWLNEHDIRVYFKETNDQGEL